MGIRPLASPNLTALTLALTAEAPDLSTGDAPTEIFSVHLKGYPPRRQLKPLERPHLSLATVRMLDGADRSLHTAALWVGHLGRGESGSGLCVCDTRSTY
jgi:hypothetical protein